jgi:hypothetical protein
VRNIDTHDQHHPPRERQFIASSEKFRRTHNDKRNNESRSEDENPVEKR